MAFLHDPHLQDLDGNGDPRAGAKLYFYEVGTVTPIATYQDAALTTPHVSPVVADASGLFAPVYINTSSYKTLLTDADDVVVQTVQTVYGTDANSLGAAGLTSANAFTKTQSWAKGTDIGDADIDGSNILTLPADGNTFNFTGTQQLDEIATVGVGTVIKIIHGSARQITHDATDMILPGGANITTVSGDVSEWTEYATGDWICTNYQRGASFPATQSYVDGKAIAFRAHKNNVDQTGIITATYTKLTFGTEAFDQGGYYDISTSRWTPPAGICRLNLVAHLSGGQVDDGAVQAAIYKNGTILAEVTTRNGGANTISSPVTILDAPNGTDYYEAYFRATGTGNKTVSGATYLSWFEAEMI
jgi:hypothetical protein